LSIFIDEIGRPLVDSVMGGFNAAVIAYGQTGSGKTHTMIGASPGGIASPDTGMIPRLTADLFGRIECDATPTTSRSSGVVYSVRSSFLEIYQERVRDLLGNAATFGTQDLELREEVRTWQGAEGQTAAAAGAPPVPGVIVEGAAEVPVSSWADVSLVLAHGNRTRAQASTRSNEHSSRSHAIFALTIRAHDLSTGITTTSQLYAVDLAGSESVRHVEVGGLQMEEAKKINTSLLALGQVVYSLTQGKRGRSAHIPYRNSKLTRIMSNTFGGNSRTALILTVSPANLKGSYRETVSSLRFGDRSQRITNRPVVVASRSAEELEGLLALERLALGDAGESLQRAQRELGEAGACIEALRGEVAAAKAVAAGAARAAAAARARAEETETESEGEGEKASTPSTARAGQGYHHRNHSYGDSYGAAVQLIPGGPGHSAYSQSQHHKLLQTLECAEAEALVIVEEARAQASVVLAEAHREARALAQSSRRATAKGMSMSETRHRAPVTDSAVTDSAATDEEWSRQLDSVRQEAWADMKSHVEEIREEARREVTAVREECSRARSSSVSEHVHQEQTQIRELTERLAASESALTALQGSAQEREEELLSQHSLTQRQQQQKRKQRRPCGSRPS
jgi:hypothetical protein